MITLSVSGLRGCRWTDVAWGSDDNLWRKFCAVAGLEHVVDDPRFRTNADRAARREETDTIVQEAIARKPVAFWNDELAKVGVPCAPINTLKQVLEHPHTEASGVLVKYDHPHGGAIQSVGQAFVLGGEERVAGTPPPLHGEHTEAILQEVGFTTQQVSELRSAKVIL